MAPAITPSPSPSPPPASGPRGREDRWRGGRGSDSEETPRSQPVGLGGGREVAVDMPESSRSRRMVRSEVLRDEEEEGVAFDELDDSDEPIDDPIDDEGGNRWEEPSHVTRKRGRRAGRKVAARAARPERVVGAYDEFYGLCLLCTQPGHRAADCTVGPVCLRCGEAGHMARECALPRPQRPSSPPGGAVEPARKRVNDGGRARRVDDGAGDHRARAPVVHQAARASQARHGVAQDGLDRRMMAPRRAEAPLRVDAAPRRAAVPHRAAPRREAPPPRAAEGRHDVQLRAEAAVGARAVAPVPVGDRAIAPVLPLARRAEEVPRPRRGADEQVAPLALRAPAVGGELARRPARAACVLPRTAEIDDAEDALAKALLAVIVGVRRAVTTEEVAMALEDIHGLPKGSFSVHCHRPEDFLIFFARREDRDRVLADEVLASPFFRLLLRPWARRTHAVSGGLCVHVDIEMEGVPANAWNLAMAEAVLAPAAWVERLHPLTRSRADMGTYRLSAWCLDPALIPKEVDLHIVEPDVPPSLEDMAAPAQAVVPPHINTLAYPLIVHVTNTVDFRRAAPRDNSTDRAGDGDGGTPAWPTRRHYDYTRGKPDDLPGSGGGSIGGAAASSGQGGGGHGGTTRLLSSGAIVGEPVAAPSRHAKRRRRGGRKVRELRARAAAFASATVAEDGEAADGAVVERGEAAVVTVAEQGEAAVGAVGERGEATVGAVTNQAGCRRLAPVLITAADAASERATPARSAAVVALDTLVPAAPCAMGSVTPVHTPSRPMVDPVHSPVHQLVDLVAVKDRSKAAGHVRVGPENSQALVDAAGSKLAVASNTVAGGGASVGRFRVGGHFVPFGGSPASSHASEREAEPPSVQRPTLEELAGPYIPRPLLGLAAFASPRADADGGPLAQDELESPSQAVILYETLTPSRMLADADGGKDVGVDDDEVDEEIVADLIPQCTVQEDCTASTPCVTSPSVCRFASPPMVFQRSRQTPVPRVPVTVARPRTLGEFLEAAKSRSDALLQTPAVRRRLVELNFQPRRSSRIAKQPGGMNAEMKAVRNLMRKLGLLSGDEAPSTAALEAYHKMYELPLTDDMIEAIAEFYGWTLSTIRGCSPPMLGMSGGRLVEA
ncbi:hypothetical protein QYE76_006228 [Lolium multiflorum]|uniref:CCHC-type domain-containing protein n=1 Tax=Lolium multiflorum TaxID=4521 RepID=A0AAD8RVH0_LOLMU|nr:hypothetical protein QYE76_006228 [Lolium multiflorum]